MGIPVWYEFVQNVFIDKAQQTADTASARSSSNRHDVRDLQAQIDQLSIVVLAMSELLETVGFSEEMLKAKIREIDLRDGKLDHRWSREMYCGGCGRKRVKRHLACMYCGDKSHMSKIRAKGINKKT